MERDGSALALVNHLHLETQDIAELVFKRFKIGIYYLGSVASIRVRRSSATGV